MITDTALSASGSHSLILCTGLTSLGLIAITIFYLRKKQLSSGTSRLETAVSYAIGLTCSFLVPFLMASLWNKANPTYPLDFGPRVNAFLEEWVPKVFWSLFFAGNDIIQLFESPGCLIVFPLLFGCIGLFFSVIRLMLYPSFLKNPLLKYAGFFLVFLSLLPAIFSLIPPMSALKSFMPIPLPHSCDWCGILGFC